MVGNPSIPNCSASFAFAALLLSGELFHPREIDLQQHEMLRRVILELRLREDLSFQHDARRTPIGTGKLDQEQFLLGSRARLRSFEVR